MRTTCRKARRYNSCRLRSSMSALTRTVGLLIVGGEMLSEVPTPRVCTPSTKAAAICPVSSGSSEKYSKLRPPRRAFEVDAGAEDNRHSCVRASSAMTLPARRARSGSHVWSQGDRRWKAGGGHAAGDAAEMVAGAFLLA